MSEHVAAEVRAILGRRGTSVRAFAVELGKPEHWTIRRLGMKSRTTDLTLDDAQLIADGLGVPLVDLLPPSS